MKYRIFYVLMIINLLLTDALPKSSPSDAGLPGNVEEGMAYAAPDPWKIYIPLVIRGGGNNQPPAIPSGPSPFNGAAAQSRVSTLRWTGSDPDGDVVMYDVYFEAYDTTPDVRVARSREATFYQPGWLETNTTYYWQIVAYDQHSLSTPSPVWNFTTSVEMILIPAGNFEMGCDPAHNGGLACVSDELPLHTVYLNDYRIDKTEVTNAQYVGCVAAGGCTAPINNYSKTRISYYGNPAYVNYPVIYVDWNQATAYCAWAGKRLPTEAEWEKAARGPNLLAFPWGDGAPTHTLANYLIDFNGSDTNAVGNHPSGASPYGVFDMAGNVWEWVNDWYGEGYYHSFLFLWVNPQGPKSGEYRVMRGGSWFNSFHWMRVAIRNNYNPVPYDRDVGFRCAAPP